MPRWLSRSRWWPKHVLCIEIYKALKFVYEGYQEPRVDENGKPYLAVVATSVVSKLMQSQRKSQISARGLE